MGSSISKVNSRLSFDFDEYLRDREELADDLRSIAADAAKHRQIQGSWQVLQGASGVAAGIAGGVALVAAPMTLGLSLPAVATTAAVVGNSISAAALASSAASYAHGHVVDKDIAKRLQNLKHVIHSIARKDIEIDVYFRAAKQTSEDEASQPKSADENVSTNTGKRSSTRQPLESKDPEDSKDDGTVETQTSDNEQAKDGECNLLAVKACSSLSQVYDDWDVANRENKTVGFDLAFALVKSSGLILGANSIIQGTRTATQAKDSFESALISTASTVDAESQAIRLLDFRFLRCIPTFRSLPRGRLWHVDGGGGGQVKMIVSFQNNALGAMGTRETLISDSTQAIRLPEWATDVKVHFQDRMGKSVHKVNRADAKQPWVKDADGRPVVEECEFDFADGVDAVFVIKGNSLTHAYVHKAWDFGRCSYSQFPSMAGPRSWEWWDDAEEESKKVAPKIEERKLAREVTTHSTSCGMLLCMTPQDMPFLIDVAE